MTRSLTPLLCAIFLMGCGLFNPAPSYPTPGPELTAIPDLPPLQAQVIQPEAGFVVDMEFTPGGQLIYALLNGQIYRKTLDFDKPWQAPPVETLGRTRGSQRTRIGAVGSGGRP